MHLRTACLAIALLVLGLASTASADVLWDQSDFDPFGAGFFNSESGEPPFGMTQYCVNDVMVTGDGWMVESISIYFSALDPFWGDGILEGKLHLFPKTGPLPVDGVDDPTASPVVAMSGVFVDDHIVVTASGLSLEVLPGEYWIGITPVAPSGGFGPEIHLSSMTLMGDASASYDPFAFPGPPAWFQLNPGVDAAIFIEGTPIQPTPTTETSWGQVKALFQ